MTPATTVRIEPGGGRKFGWALAALALASLAPIWLPRYLPLQDYPHHLFVAQVLATYDDPAFDWRQTYDAALAFNPYVIFYAFVATVGRWVGVDAAGRVFLSLYVLLIATAVWRAWRSRWSEAAPWPLLLVFPAAFSQIWYLGFANYLLSLPVLMLSLLELDRFVAAPLGAKPVARMGGWIVLAFLAHPFTLLLLSGLAAARSLSLLGERAKALRAGSCALAGLGLLLGWSLTHAAEAGLAGGLGAVSASWVAPAELLRYFLLPFVGLRWNGGIDWLPALAWGGLLAIIAVAARTGASGTQIDRIFAGHAAVVLVGYLALPFWFGEYSYFNLRLAAAVLLLAPLAIGGIALPTRAGLALAALCLALVGNTVWLHLRLSAEVAEIAPLFAQMHPNARLRRILYDASARAIDAGYYPEFHAHDFFYYHVAVGGGSNPYLLPNRMMPLRYNAAHAAWASADHAFDPGMGVAGDYDYLLVRGAGEVPAGHRLLGRSGAWALYAH